PDGPVSGGVGLSGASGPRADAASNWGGCGLNALFRSSNENDLLSTLAFRSSNEKVLGSTCELSLSNVNVSGITIPRNYRIRIDQAQHCQPIAYPLEQIQLMPVVCLRSACKSAFRPCLYQRFDRCHQGDRRVVLR